MKTRIFASLLPIFTLIIPLSSYSQNTPSVLNQPEKKTTYSLSLGNQFHISNNTLYFSSDIRVGDRVFIADLKGKKIFGYEHELDISRITLPKITPGMYIVSILRKGTVINKHQIMVGMSSN